MASVQPALTLMEQVLDMAESPAALQGDTVHFWYDDTQIQIEKGDEPRMTGCSSPLMLLPSILPIRW
ncbi:MAG: hypothetical protein J6T11_06330 [Bacteroidaceae bacterium]|nr:hypothetical protein [Bacteroidaceae bacterium]